MMRVLLCLSFFSFMGGNGHAWVISTIATPDGHGTYDTKGKYSSLAIDSHSKAHISYMDQRQADPSSYSYNLSHITNSTGTWIEEVLGTGYPIWRIDAGMKTGNFAALAVDKNDKIHISFMECYDNIPNYGFSYDVIQASNASGSWTKRLVDSWTGTYYLQNTWTTIKTDVNGGVHLGYLLPYVDYFGTVTSSDLKYATDSSGSYESEIVDPTDNVGSDLSLTVDLNNHIHLSYYDAANSALKYATNASGSWITSTIDNSPLVGKYSSIAIDSNNKVHISYLDYMWLEALKYATNAGGTWVTSTIDSAAGVGAYSSLAVDSKNKIHISYYDKINRALRYATNAGGTWVTSTIDSDGDVGKYSSLAIDSTDYIHVSYYDSTNRSLKYAFGENVTTYRIFLPLLSNSQS